MNSEDIVATSNTTKYYQKYLDVILPTKLQKDCKKGFNMFEEYSQDEPLNELIELLEKYDTASTDTNFYFGIDEDGKKQRHDADEILYNIMDKILYLIGTDNIEELQKYSDQKYKYHQWYTFVSAALDPSKLLIVDDLIDVIDGVGEYDDRVIMDYYSSRNQITPYQFFVSSMFTEGCRSGCGEWPSEYYSIIGIDNLVSLLEIDQSIISEDDFNDLIERIFYLFYYLNVFENDPDLVKLEKFYIQYTKIVAKENRDIPEVYEKQGISSLENISFDTFATYIFNLRRESLERSKNKFSNKT